MKGVVLAGGTGSRLYPLSRTTNKHLLLVGSKPMICYPIAKLTEAGIGEILIVSGAEHMDAVAGLLGAGNEFGCRFTYRAQDRPGGIAQALALAESFASGEKIVAILGDNIFEASIRPYVEAFQRQPKGAMLLLKEVDDPRRFGVAEIQDGRIVSIEEKPARPKSNLCVTGIYMYDNTVYDIIRELKPSQRGELEITDVNNAYVRRNELTYEILPGWWMDSGTTAALRRANKLVSD